MRYALSPKWLVICLLLAFGVNRQGCAEEFREYTADSTARYTQAAFSSDNRLLAAVGLLSKSNRALVVLWDLKTGERVARLSDFPEECARIAFSPDSTMLAVGCGNGSIHLFAVNRDKWRRVHLIQHRPPTTYHNMSEDFAFTSDSRELISTCRVKGTPYTTHCRGLAVTSLHDRMPDSRFIPLKLHSILSLSLLDGNGQRVVICNYSDRNELQLSVIDTAAKTVIEVIPASPAPKGIDDSLALEATYDGARIVAAINGGVYDVTSEPFGIEQRFTVADRISNYYGLSISPDGKLIATCSLKGRIQLWEFDSGSPLASRELPMGLGVQFSADGKGLATTAIGSKSIRVWNVDELLKAR